MRARSITTWLLLVPCAGFVSPSVTCTDVRQAHVLPVHAAEMLDPANTPKDKIPEDKDLSDDPKTRELLSNVTRAELTTVGFADLRADLEVYAFAFFFSFIILGILGFFGYSELSMHERVESNISSSFLSAPLPVPRFEGLKTLFAFLSPDKKQSPDEKKKKKDIFNFLRLFSSDEKAKTNYSLLVPPLVQPKLRYVFNSVQVYFFTLGKLCSDVLLVP